MDKTISNADPQVAKVRTLLAHDFAKGVSEATPCASARMMEQAASCGSGVEKALFEHVALVLSSHRAQFTMQVDHSVRRRFDDRLDCPADSFSHSGCFSVGAIRLFEDLGMLEELEREQAVGRLRGQFRKELLALTRRMRKLLGRERMPEAHNPVFPRVLLRAFADALANLGFDTRARRLALSVYGPLLDQIIANVYARVIAALTMIPNTATQAIDMRERRPRSAATMH